MIQGDETLLMLTADIVAAHVSNNTVALGDVPALLQNVHGALMNLGRKKEEEEAPARPEPKVSVRSSVKPDAIICLACGKRRKTLKRHLATSHGMSPAEYRETYGLRPDYPMVALDYAARRRDLAKKSGLGARRWRGQTGGSKQTGPAGTGNGRRGRTARKK